MDVVEHLDQSQPICRAHQPFGNAAALNVLPLSYRFRSRVTAFPARGRPDIVVHSGMSLLWKFCTSSVLRTRFCGVLVAFSSHIEKVISLHVIVSPTIVPTAG